MRPSHSQLWIQPSLRALTNPKNEALQLLGRQGILRDCSVCGHEAGMHKCCPQCSETAANEDEIELLFGFRTISDKTGRYQIPQTWCRDCRKRSLKRI